ncbi:MAG: pyridoxamine 5'-phosphate oxidase [Chitinophagaceae bacterium]|jgi:pyridoxamine 5'-phosphate oxidase|nr:pyridoxamine 5'-phosphate oxidase [Chitinophagaceae bacterium]
MDIANIRADYRLKTLNENEVEPNPINQFEKWFQEAIDCKIDEVNAMTLATTSSGGKPHARIVLLKDIKENKFQFYTNYLSHKGAQIQENPHVALVFFWKELQRQVRIEGIIEKTSEAESDTYFHSRPAGSRIGAWASPQSSVIESRTVLEENADKYLKAFGNDIPRPSHWGGYNVAPLSMEFWQGRSNRLHDRILYSFIAGSWKIERLAP